jgi:hypothetical protein
MDELILAGTLAPRFIATVLRSTLGGRKFAHSCRNFFTETVGVGGYRVSSDPDTEDHTTHHHHPEIVKRLNCAQAIFA